MALAPRYTEQLVLLETAETRRYVEERANKQNRPMTEILRELIAAGRPVVDQWYARQGDSPAPYPVPLSQASPTA
jgi:hypothetical protein